MSPPNEAETGKHHDTVYLSFEAASVNASESKASKVDDGAPVINQESAAMEMTSPSEEKPNEEAAPNIEEVPPVITADQKPDSSALIDE